MRTLDRVQIGCGIAWGVALAAGLAFAGWYRLLALFPELSQGGALRRILGKNAGSDYGRDRGLRPRMSVDEYRSRVPVGTYESFRPYIESAMKDGRDRLTCQPIRTVTSTSGTTGRPKYILKHPAVFGREYLKATCLMLLTCFLRQPSAFASRVALIVAGPEEGEVGAVHHRAIANQVYQETPVGALLALPPEIFRIQDYAARCYYIALFVLATKARTVITPNAATLIKLAESASRFEAELASELESGRLANRFGIDAALFDGLARKFSGERTAGCGLGLRIAERFGAMSFTTWQAGMNRLFVEELRSGWCRGARFFDLGYFASDSPAMVHIGRAGQIAALDDVFLEFRDRASSEARIVRYHELRMGGQYEMIVTNRYGLYRYDIGDIVQVVGRIGRSPALQFVRKTDGFASMAGEKLSEEQVIAAVTAAAGAAGLAPRFFTCIPVASAHCYRLYLELHGGDVDALTLSERFDLALCELNIEYRSRRESQRLSPSEARVLGAGALDAFKTAILCHPSREAQFKPRPLYPDDRYRDVLDSLSAASPHPVHACAEC